MYVPPAFQEPDHQTAFALIEQIRLGTLVTAAGPIRSSHVPFMVDPARGPNGTLIGHVAKANPQWRDLDPEVESLVTFVGPDAYISPSWYGTSPRAPTWTYVAIHAYGRPTMVFDPAALRAMVLRLCDTMEPPSSLWRASNLPDAFIDRLVTAIVGFEIAIERLETQLRLGQNNGMDDRRRMHAGLTARAAGDDLRVAELMARFSLREDG